MKHLRRWIYILVLLTACLLGFLFNSENPATVQVMVLGNALPEGRLGVWLLGFTLLGLLLGILVSAVPTLTQKRRLAGLLRRNHQLEQEVQVLRSQSLRD